MKPTHIADCVRSNLEIYLRDLGSSEPHSMYGMVVVGQLKSPCWSW
jgi:DNA-binding protein Fis